MPELSAEEVEKLSKDFKRCGPETVDAILKFRRDGDDSVIPVIVRGVLRRYLRDEAKEFVDTAGADTPLSSLGVDSLTMLEIMLDVQDALDVTVDDAELRKLQTIGDVVQMLGEKANHRGLA